VTGHYWGSKRKAGFHWLADALARAGWEVLFFTTPLSWVSAARKDPRMAYPVRREANRIVPQGGGLSGYVWYTPFHPCDFRSGLLNRLARPLFARFGDLPLGEAEPFIRGADLFVFDSLSGILLFDRFKRLNPDARFVYRVSDNLREMLNPPLVVEAEDRIAPLFDLVSVPNRVIYELFEGLPRLRLQAHGIRKDLYDGADRNPYPPGETPNVVFVGNSMFDVEFLDAAASFFPDWSFHIIGPIPGLPEKANVRAYGEIPFAETVPYVKYADIGLQNLVGPTAPTMGDSLKVIQYTYCRLPIVASDVIRSDRPNFCYYTPGDPESVRAALERAARFDRSAIPTGGIYSWDELAAELAADSAGEGRETPPGDGPARDAGGEA
jgi:2-beta-glucuronyltransferase